MTRFFLMPLAMLSAEVSYTQDSIARQKQLVLSIYAEPYYSYDFNQPADNKRPGFVYSYNRHHEINLNLAYIKLGYSSKKTRANLALATGTYMNANYAAEPGAFRIVYEANAGVKLLPDANLWIDAGVLPSHIGFESAHSPGCWTLTRSMVADNSPYFEAGARLSYETADHKIYASLLALNGWQRITRLNGNSLMCWGSQFTWKPTENSTFNYSTFIGTDQPDSSRQWRIYHNLYTVLSFSGKLALTAGFDLGTEQVAKNSKRNNVWFSPVAILRFVPTKSWAFALRGEYFNDAHSVIVPGFGLNGFKTGAYSVNADRKIGDHCLWRMELKNYHSSDPVFSRDGIPGKHCLVFTTAFAISFTDDK